MQTVNRRKFIGNTSIAIAGIVFAGDAVIFEKNIPRLSFTTLGCPDWGLPKIVDFAATNGYAEIEIRGVLRELDLSKVPELSSNRIDETMRMMKDRGLKFVCLGSAAHVHDADAKLRETNLDNAKKYIDLAHKLNCPFIRVFPDIIPKEQERNQTFDLVIKGLQDLAQYAKGSDISILLECSSGISGDFVKADDMSFIMENANHPQVGLVWNPSHMWSVTKEAPALVYEKLKKYIKHTHIKDLKLVNGSIQGAVSYDVLLGEGEAPIPEAVRSLYKGNYSGSYCCEWEKFWYPEMQDPEIAFTHFAKEIKKYFTL